MITKQSIEETIDKYGLAPFSSFTKNNSACLIKKGKSGIEIELTIPINVYEIFFKAKDLSTSKAIDDWRDYYGEDKEKDYIEDLESILLVLSEKDIRFSDDKKTIEYQDGDWKYFFGHMKE